MYLYIVYIERNNSNDIKVGPQYLIISFYLKDMSVFNELAINMILLRKAKPFFDLIEGFFITCLLAKFLQHQSMFLLKGFLLPASWQVLIGDNLSLQSFQ